VVAWLERKGARAEVRVRRIAPDGTLKPPVVVGATSAARASGYPTLAVERDRDVLVAWTETGSTSRIRSAVVTPP
jgi:hypothetical protein